MASSKSRRSLRPAAEIHGAERDAYLDRACAGDAALRERLVKLLEAADETRPMFQPGRRSDGQVGRYHLLQRIGEGGMGEVWLAEQKEPVRRRVAVKLIKTGMNTPDVIARFESERQALALMDHPAIARSLTPVPRPKARRTSSWNTSPVCPSPRTATTIGTARASGWNYSCTSAKGSSTPTRKPSSTAT